MRALSHERVKGVVYVADKRRKIDIDSPPAKISELRKSCVTCDSALERDLVEVFQKIVDFCPRPHFGLKISQLPAPTTISRNEFNRAKISELSGSTGKWDTGLEIIFTLYSQKIVRFLIRPHFGLKIGRSPAPIYSKLRFRDRIQSCKDLRTEREYGKMRNGDREHCYPRFPENYPFFWFDHILVSNLVGNQRPVTEKLSAILDDSLFLSIVTN